MPSGLRDHTLAEFKGTERFAVQRKLGAGAMGVVYRAYDRATGTPVALKTLRQLDAAAIYRFKQEFRALADVIHPNLATLYELMSVGEDWFFTMELIEGWNFLEYVRGASESALAETVDRSISSGTEDTLAGSSSTSSGTDETLPSGNLSSLRPALVTAQPGVPAPPVDFKRLRNALRQLAEGVFALHAAGKLHRDLKPSNVMVTPEGRVVVLDFGLVLELDPEGRSTGDRSIVGTIAYMAPEQAATQELSPASDWYSIGVILYEALTGRLPYSGKHLQVLMDKQRVDPPAPRSLVPETPEDLNGLCMELLRRNPAERPSGEHILSRLGAKHRAASSVRSAQAQALLIGREQHFEALDEAFHAVRKGAALTVYVHGRSGMGKSALVQQFLEEIEAAGDAVVLAGRCYERESVPYKAFDAMVDALCRYLVHLPREQVQPLLPRDIQALARIFPVLRQVRAIADAAKRAFVTPDVQELRRRAFVALRELLARLTEKKPVVLYIDDLQWGDVDSAALLGDLLRPPDPPAVLVLCNYRSEDAQAPILQALRAQPAPPGSVRELSVDPLTPDEARSLALALLGPGDLGARKHVDAIATESGGNPLFVAELVRHVQAGVALSAGNVSLDQMLRARVDQLPPAARELLEVVAVAGRPLLRQVAFAATETTDDHAGLAALRSGHLVRSKGTGEQLSIEPFHDRIRETVVGLLSAERIKQCHTRLANALEASQKADPEALAMHFRAAGEPARAAEYAALAAGRAAEALAFDRAAMLYRMALDLGSPSDEQARELRGKLGDALANAGRGADAAKTYLLAAEGAGPAEALEFRRRAAEQLLRCGHVDEGLEVFRAVLGAVGMKLAKTPRRALASLLFRRAHLRLRGTRFKERDLSQIKPADLTKIDVCWSVSLGLGLIDVIRGNDFQTRQMLLALRAGEPYRISRMLAFEAAYTSTAGSKGQKRADRLIREAEALVERLKNPHALGLIQLMTGILSYELGRFEPCRDACDRAEAIFRDRCANVEWEVASARLFGTWALFRMGEIAELARRVPSHVREAAERGDLYAHTAATTGLCNVGLLVATDDIETRRRETEAALAAWSHRGFHVQHYWCLYARTQIELYAGNGAESLEVTRKMWPGLESSLLMRVQEVYIYMHEVRARGALAAALDAKKGEEAPLLRQAARDAAKIERLGTHWGGPLALLLRAQLAAAGGQREEELALLARAAEALDGVAMAMHAHVARHRRGKLLGGDAGRRLVDEAERWAASQNVKDFARLRYLIAPGLCRRHD